jgi:hypothetical protein
MKTTLSHRLIALGMVLLVAMVLSSCVHSGISLDTGEKPRRLEITGGYSWQGGHYASGGLCLSVSGGAAACLAISSDIRFDSTLTVIPTISLSVNGGPHVGLDIGYATDGTTGGILIRPTFGYGYRTWKLCYGYNIAAPSVPGGLARHCLIVSVPIIALAQW